MKTKICRFLLVAQAAAAPLAWAAQLPYTIVDPGQLWCYENRGEIAPPKPGQPFYGQDAQFKAHPASFTKSADGLTVLDNQTGLTWPSSADTDGNGVLDRNDKLTWKEALAFPAKLNARKFGGFSDWRLPGIKEIYSLFDARGVDPSGPTMTEAAPGLRPYLDTNYFKFVYGDTAAGARIIDAQYASATKYLNPSPRGGDKVFGVNFADGRIKGYDQSTLDGREFKFFVLCVRGNPSYGKNDFQVNNDGSITDRATGLIWSKADSGQGMNWEQALAWAQKKNAENYLGHNDWRLPNIKELQSLVDYTRSPDSSHSPAIDPLFACSSITNQGGQPDYPYYWSSTTHGGFMGGSAAMYVPFGRAGGWMSPRGPLGKQGPGGGFGPGAQSGKGKSSSTSEQYRFVDVHGAGCQRSDPKVGDPSQFPHGRGPQGDAIHINNYVRLVRGGEAQKKSDAEMAPLPKTDASRQQRFDGPPGPGQGGFGGPRPGRRPPLPPRPL